MCYIFLPEVRATQLAVAFFRAKKARASGRNVSKVFNPVVKLVLENYPYSCLSQLRSPHFNHGQACANYSHTVSGPIGLNKNQA